MVTAAFPIESVVNIWQFGAAQVSAMTSSVKSQKSVSATANPSWKSRSWKVTSTGSPPVGLVREPRQE